MNKILLILFILFIIPVVSAQQIIELSNETENSAVFMGGTDDWGATSFNLTNSSAEYTMYNGSAHLDETSSLGETFITGEIRTDNSGEPSSTILGGGNFTLVPALSTTPHWYDVIFNDLIVLQNDTKYWFVIRGDGSNTGRWNELTTGGKTKYIRAFTGDTGSTWTVNDGQIDLNFYVRGVFGLVATVTVINQSSYNVSSARNVGNRTLWSTNTSLTVLTTDSTPTVIFNVDKAGNCSIGKSNQNFTDMTTANADTKCGTTGTKLHTCTLPVSDQLSNAVQDIFISCTDGTLENASSSSGTLSINLSVVPTVNINLTLDNSVTTDTTPPVDYNFTDPDSSVADCTLFFDDVARDKNIGVSNNTNDILTVNVTLADKNYSVYVNCTDQSDNIGKSSVISILIDTTAPVISGVTARSITATTAIINWTTNETSNSSVNFGTTKATLGTFVGNDTNVTSHNISLTGLVIETQYFYNVTSCDPSGNCNTNGTFNFTTVITSFSMLFFDGVNASRKYELQYNFNITVNGSNGTIGSNVSVSIFHPDFGVNFSVGPSPLSIIINITSLNVSNFNGSSTSVLAANGSITRIILTNNSELWNLSFNVTGVTVSGYPVNISIHLPNNDSSFLDLRGEFLISVLVRVVILVVVLLCV